MPEFNPASSGFDGQQEAYQQDYRGLQREIQALRAELDGLKKQQSVGASGTVVQVVPSSQSPGSGAQQTLPHTHLSAEVTDLAATLASASFTTSQITDLAEFIRDTVATFVVQGTGITITNDDALNTLTFDVP